MCKLTLWKSKGTTIHMCEIQRVRKRRDVGTRSKSNPLQLIRSKLSYCLSNEKEKKPEKMTCS